MILNRFLVAIFCLLSIVFLPINASADPADIIVDGGTISVAGGSYNNIVVKNNGILTITSSVTANQVSVEWGTMTVNGNINVSGSIDILNNTYTPKTITINGSNNSAQNIYVYSGILNLLGTWNVNNMLVGPGGKADVITLSGSKPGSGKLVLNCSQFIIDANGELDASGDGNDGRGQGNDWYRDSAAGGYGGKGGRGYWDSSSNGGYVYGDQYSFNIEMGSRGGYNGGGSITIVATNSITINGAIKSDGITSYNSNVGGGSGGGILIKSPLLNVTGIISAIGGNGYDTSGGGGGGRVKVFYETGASTSDLSGKIAVTGGTRGGYLNTQNGGTGTVWIDAIPNPPALLTPANGEVLSTNVPHFGFSVVDQSSVLDGRDDDLACIIEISKDNFSTIYKTYSQNISLSGWSKFSYKTGDTASFVSEESLPAGTYSWRVCSRDKSITSRYSEIKSFVVPEGSTVEPSVHLSDIIVDGDIAVASGDYRYILIKNNGSISFSGDTTANKVYVEWGTITVNGNLNVSDSITIPANPTTPKILTVYGNTNSSDTINLYSGTMNFLGTWDVDNIIVGAGSKADVVALTSSWPGSGTLVLNCYQLTVDSNGLLDASGDGNDGRGQGNDWYRDSAAGGYGGKGGRGYWNSSANGGYTYGDQYSFAIEMGSRGGYNGGGSITIVATNSITINGAIKSDGITSDSSNTAGGSGGGVLIKTPRVNCPGIISAKGGNGGYYSGGGGGGRVKIFYEYGITTADLLSKINVAGGLRGGYLNTQNGGAGTIRIGHTLVYGTIYKEEEGQKVGLEGAMISVMDIMRTTTLAYCYTDANGKFWLVNNDIPDGNYIIKTSKASYNTYSGMTILRKTQSLPFSVTLYPPVMGAVPQSVLVNSDESYSLNISATDQNKDKLSFSSMNLPEGASLTDNNNNTATFNWTPTNFQGGVHKVSFDVTDGLLTANAVVDIEVKSTNNPPQISPVLPAEIYEGNVLKFMIKVVDPDGDTIIFSSGNLPRGAVLNSQTGEFTWTPDFDQQGSHSINFKASDSKGGEDVEVCAVSVINSSIYGVIRDIVTKKPLPNATIKVYKNIRTFITVSTDSNGKYVIPANLTSGIYICVIQADNYLSAIHPVRVFNNKSTEYSSYLRKLPWVKR